MWFVEPDDERGDVLTGLTVFSDLDGTLLDHDNYSFERAKPALAELRTRGARLVLASSKTAAEVEPIRAALGFSDCPAIVENGAGILGASDTQAASRYQELRSLLDRVDPMLRAEFRGFADMGPDAVQRHTGLASDQVSRAMQRRFSEPGLFLGSPSQETAFVAALGQVGLVAQYGGRFLTVSFGASKAERMRELRARFGGRTLALGDAPNDAEMIEAADRGVIVLNRRGTPIPRLEGEKEGRITRTTQEGPEGWSAAVFAELDLLTEA